MIAKLNIVQDELTGADALTSRVSHGGLSAIREGDEPNTTGQEDDDDEPNQEEIFRKACDLSDQGFGEFDVCLTVLTATKGNVDLARKALSKVIFSN